MMISCCGLSTNLFIGEMKFLLYLLQLSFCCFQYSLLSAISLLFPRIRLVWYLLLLLLLQLLLQLKLMGRSRWIGLGCLRSRTVLSLSKLIGNMILGIHATSIDLTRVESSCWLIYYIVDWYICGCIVNIWLLMTHIYSGEWSIFRFVQNGAKTSWFKVHWSLHKHILNTFVNWWLEELNRLSKRINPFFLLFYYIFLLFLLRWVNSVLSTVRREGTLIIATTMELELMIETLTHIECPI
jgi:hypothetical protein